jgi:hypothetical protein
LLVSCERSIMPTFGETKLATVVSESVAVAALPDCDSLPQAARVSVARVHRRTLRTCERAARANCVMNHYPGKTLKRSARAALRLAGGGPWVAAYDPNYDKHCCLPVTPLSRACYSSRPEALRPRLTTGLPLRCEASKQEAKTCRNRRPLPTVNCCNSQKAGDSHFSACSRPPIAASATTCPCRTAFARMCTAPYGEKLFWRVVHTVRQVSD